MLTKVKDHSSLMKDQKTGMIVNVDSKQLAAAKAAMLRQQEHDTLVEENKILTNRLQHLEKQMEMILRRTNASTE